MYYNVLIIHAAKLQAIFQSIGGFFMEEITKITDNLVLASLLYNPIKIAHDYVDENKAVSCHEVLILLIFRRLGYSHRCSFPRRPFPRSDTYGKSGQLESYLGFYYININQPPGKLPSPPLCKSRQAYAAA